WDLAGNVWEHVNKANTIDGSDYGTTTNKTFVGKLTTDADAGGVELNTIVTDYFKANVLPKNTALLKTNGIGGLWFYDGTVFLRGGNARDSTGDGVFALYLLGSSATRGCDIGFRCAR
ncbi:MAG: hypothetical protein PHH70_03905, partial [Candidatus Gracilibacteria bacterium]|nr:hypothetical protein [Candidatus Gracilibacteria bacterium]